MSATYTLTEEQLLRLMFAGFGVSAEGYNGEYSSTTDAIIKDGLRAILKEELAQIGETRDNP